MDDLKKWMNRMTATWRSGCFEEKKMIFRFTLPNCHSTKMAVIPKTFVQIILAAKWLVRHSSMFLQTTAMIFAFSSVFILLLCLLLSPDPELYKVESPDNNIQCTVNILVCTHSAGPWYWLLSALAKMSVRTTPGWTEQLTMRSACHLLDIYGINMELFFFYL